MVLGAILRFFLSETIFDNSSEVIFGVKFTSLMTNEISLCVKIGGRPVLFKMSAFPVSLCLFKILDTELSEIEKKSKKIVKKGIN